MGWVLLSWQQADATPDGAGGQHIEWRAKGEIWGQRTRYSGRHDQRDGVARDFFFATWRLRDLPRAMSIGDQLVDGDVRYEIQAIEATASLDQIVLTRTEQADGITA